MGKSIFAALTVLVVLGLVWAFYKPQDSSRSGGPSQAYAAFQQANFKDTARITISKGLKGTPVELKKAGEKWVVASSFGYPADGEKIDKIVKALDELKPGEPRGRQPEAHGEYDVDEKKGVYLAAYAADGKELGRLVVGKHASSRNFSVSAAYLRFGDDATTYEVETTLRNEISVYGDNAEGKTYLQKKVFSAGEDQEVQSVRLSQSGKDDLLVERRFKEVPVEKPATPPADPAAPPPAEPPKPETKKEEYFVVTSGPETKDVDKTKEWTARGLLNRAKDLSIDDAVEPKDLKEYGLDQPQLKATVTYRKKEPADSELKTITFLFGNELKDDKGETKGYYAVVDNEEHKGRVYLVSKYTLEDWKKKEMKEFLPDPPKPPEPAPAPTPAPAPDASTPPAPAPAPAPAPTPTPTPAPAPGAGSEAAPAPPPAPAPAPTPAPAPPPAPAPQPPPDK